MKIFISIILCVTLIMANEKYECSDPKTKLFVFNLSYKKNSDAVISMKINNKTENIHLKFQYERRIDDYDAVMGDTLGFYRNEIYGLNIFYNSLPEYQKYKTVVFMDAKSANANVYLCRKLKY